MLKLATLWQIVFFLLVSNAFLFEETAAQSPQDTDTLRAECLRLLL